MEKLGKLRSFDR